MYTLKLSLTEESAIDWIGNRYRHGNELRHCLMLCEHEINENGNCIYKIPEHIAWQIQEIGEEDNWACFATRLIIKLEAFCMEIV